MAMMLSNQELAKAIQKGDQKAFQHFFDAHFNGLIRFLRQRSAADDDAEDIVQQAFIYLWENRLKIDPEKSLKAYLYRIVYTRFLNVQQRNQRFEQDEKLDFNESSHPTTDQDLDYTELRQHLAIGIQQMPEKRRMVFQLCFMEELTYKEAAESLDISVNTVENHMQKAFKQLREFLQKKSINL